MTDHPHLTHAEIYQIEAALDEIDVADDQDRPLFILAYGFAASGGFVMGLAVMWAAVKAGWV